MAEPERDDQAKQSLAAQFNAAGYELTSQPAPDKSLKTAGIGPIVGNLLKQNNAVYFGEWHDDVNTKFLADNPEIMQEAKARKADKLFIELGSANAPLFKSYFNGRITEAEFEKQLTEHGKGWKLTSGDTDANEARQLVALCKTARENGVRVLPSDFRDLDPNTKGNLPVRYTSDVYGIPDVQSRDDAVRHQTLLSLDEYRKTHNGDLPATRTQQVDFKYLHDFRLADLSDDEKARFNQDLNVRSEEFAKDAGLNNLNYQNQLQFNYYSMVVEPGEKAMLFGGRNHITEQDGMGDILKQNGYGTTGSVQLLSEGGVVHDKGRAVLGVDTPNAELPHPYDYTVHTSTGEILKGKDEKMAPPVPEAPAADARPQDKKPQVPAPAV